MQLEPADALVILMAINISESDFSIPTEIQNYLQLGSLTHVDVAFSRDQAEKSMCNIKF